MIELFEKQECCYPERINEALTTTMCHPERTGPQALFSLGVVSEGSAVAFADGAGSDSALLNRDGSPGSGNYEAPTLRWQGARSQ
jgi:hypothetical protein